MRNREISIIAIFGDYKTSCNHGAEHGMTLNLVIRVRKLVASKKASPFFLRGLQLLNGLSVWGRGEKILACVAVVEKGRG